MGQLFGRGSFPKQELALINAVQDYPRAVAMPARDVTIGMIADSDALRDAVTIAETAAAGAISAMDAEAHAGMIYETTATPSSVIREIAIRYILPAGKL